MTAMNMEDTSPGTIIFSPQDFRQPQKKVTATAKVYKQRMKAPKTETPLSLMQQKAEKVSKRLESYKEADGPIPCDYCGRVMSSAKTLMQHMMTHEEFKPFKCVQCSKAFTRKVQLQGHMVEHGGEKQYECPICHQRFARRDCVKIHMRIHDKSKCVQCEVCYKSFLTTGALNIHMRIHRGEKPFKCHLCGKCFTQKNHLITHIKRHTNVKDTPFIKKLGPRMFQCEHCPRSFIRLSDYERHVQWNHGAVADINNMAPSTVKTQDLDQDDIKKTTRDVLKEKAKVGKRKLNKSSLPPVMCTTSTQTDEGEGHVIIPRKYRNQASTESNASAFSTPRREEETYEHEVFEEGMDRNYSSDEEDEIPGQPERKIMKIETSSCTLPPTSKDSARDAAFDAIIRSTNSSNGKNTILPDPLCEQANERVFVINTDDSSELTMTACEIPQESRSSPNLTVSSSISEKDPSNESSNTIDLNVQLGKENFLEIIQDSYRNFGRGTSLSTTTPLTAIGTSVEDTVKAALDFSAQPDKRRGRPKSKKASRKGAKQLHLIRKSMVNIISDAKNLTNTQFEDGEIEEEECNISLEEETEDEASAIHEQVLLEDGKSPIIMTKSRRVSKATHGKDYICENKKCLLCYTDTHIKSEHPRYAPMNNNSLRKVTMKREAVKAIKKEPKLAQLAEKGAKTVSEMVNLVHYGVKDLSELEEEKPKAVSYIIDNVNEINKPKDGVLSNDPINDPVELEDPFLAKTPSDSILSPAVDVNSFCIPTFSCKLCNREFRFEGKLHRHIESVHQNKNIYTEEIRPGRHTGRIMPFDQKSDMDLSSQHVSIPYEEPTPSEILPTMEQDPRSDEIEALRSEWDDDDDMDDDDREESHHAPVMVSAPVSQSVIQPVQRGNKVPIVTRSIIPTSSTFSDSYRGGISINMNKIAGMMPVMPKTEINAPDASVYSEEQQVSSYAIESLDEQSLEWKCHKLLIKLFDGNLLDQCGLGEDHIATVLGRVLRHYGVKNIEDYGQGLYEVLKYNLWRLMEWKVSFNKLNYC